MLLVLQNFGYIMRYLQKVSKKTYWKSWFFECDVTTFNISKFNERRSSSSHFMLLFLILLMRSDTEIYTESYTDTVSVPPETTYVSRSGIPSIVTVVLSCVGALLLVFLSTIFLCIKRAPDLPLDSTVLLTSQAVVWKYCKLSFCL